MNHFITNIKVNKLLHLSDFDIPIADENRPHLIITGKNGSGKTILLNAVSESLAQIKDDSNFNFLTYENQLKYYKHRKETQLFLT